MKIVSLELNVQQGGPGSLSLNSIINSTSIFLANFFLFNTICGVKTSMVPVMKLNWYNRWLPATWLSGNAFVSGLGDLWFKSLASQIGHSVANGSPPLRRFFEMSCATWGQ